MIVVEPSSMRYENLDGAGEAEEHLLERVSVLENRLGRLTERMERALDLLLRQAQNTYLDRALLKSLISLLNDDGLVENQKLERLWQQRCEEDAATQEQTTRRQLMQSKITDGYRGSDRRSFETLISEAFQIFDVQNGAAMQLLRQAAERDPENGLLLSFIGEQFFRSGNMKLARRFLARALKAIPEDNHVLLLLGLACGDEGDIEQARKLLEATTQRGGPSFAAHYGLGRLFLAEQKWQEAVREFKRALASRPSPEANYALGCLYYELGRDTLAARYLLKAVEMDAAYGEAFHLLGLVYTRAGKMEAARRAFAQVGEAVSLSPPPAKSPKSKPSLFRPLSGKRRHWLTGGDLRLAKALRDDALRVFLPVK